ncbi:MAG TPA: SPOR domain-containing protein [Steroidobacteraceae bacterium]
MRTLSLLLILCNALFLVWSQLVDVRINPLDRASPSRANPPPRIVLARELPREDTEPASGEAPSSQLAGSPISQSGGGSFGCTSVGPFANLSEAAQAQAALTAAGFSPRQRLEQGELWVGYWVSVQSFPNRDAAEEALQRLTDAGITDVYLMPSSEPGNVLSLGVFSDFQRAQRRVEEARRLGMQPQIDDRTRPGTVYWIDAELSRPGQAIDTSIFQTDPRKIMRLELKACPSESEVDSQHG